MRLRLFSASCLLALGVLGCAMTVPSVQARAYFVEAPYLECANSRSGYEGVARHIPLPGPPDGTTVLEGASVTFSGESSYALTFSVASSPALLSSPDIDSGPGLLQPGSSLYTFTSTKATITPRTIYWAASFTLIPEHCESPTTFTTHVYTLVVVAPPAGEDGTAKKKPEEGAVVTGNVSLEGPAIRVLSTHEAAIELRCTGTATCSGMLTLSAKRTTAKRKKSHAKTRDMGTVPFSVIAGQTVAIDLPLNEIGRKLLSAAYGHLAATLTILKSSPAPSETRTQGVYLKQQKAAKAKTSTR